MTKVVGVTGPIASGKNEVCKILKSMGAFIVDADQIGHELLVKDSPAWSKIVAAFGSRVLKTGGEISRKKLGDLAFSSKPMLIKLNSAIHPFLFQRIRQGIEAAKERNEKIVVINAALMNEIGLVELLDELWFVEAPLKMRIKRSKKKRRNIKRLKMIIRLQQPISRIKKAAQLIIKNDSSLKKLTARVASAYQELVKA